MGPQLRQLHWKNRKETRASPQRFRWVYPVYPGGATTGQLPVFAELNHERFLRVRGEGDPPLGLRPSAALESQSVTCERHKCGRTPHFVVALPR